MFEDAIGSHAAQESPVEPPRFVPGDVIDERFEVIESIGKGGMGTVLRVKDQKNNRIRALKYCHESGEDRKRFSREVRIMAQVVHSYVVPVFASNLNYDPPYFVMPLAEGCLEDELTSFKADEKAALEAFRKACLGIQALHSSGIVHRDNKPANILRFANGRVAVSDLGLAKLEIRDTTILTQTRAVVGTIDYLAPEQFEPAGSREADVRTDVFQMGKVLYRLLTGRSPQLIDSSILPPGLSHIVERATNHRPEDRYQSMGEMLDALRYYQLSKIESDSQATLENLVNEADELLKQHKYDTRNVRGILRLISHLKPEEARTIIQYFDRVPKGLLPVMASDFPSELLPVLRLYNGAIRAGLHLYGFSYADDVANRMRSLFRNSKSVQVQVLALHNILIAAVDKNRFYAMGIFNTLLAEIKDVAVALPVAEMLRQNADRYKSLAKGVSSDRLQAAIRAVREDVLKPEPEDDDIPF